jgi:hypothetical protein
MGMTNQDIQDNFDKILNTLNGIARNYTEDSAEYRAIQHAAQALLFVRMKDIAEKFLHFTEELGKELSAEQKAHLQSLGIDPINTIKRNP